MPSSEVQRELLDELAAAFYDGAGYGCAWSEMPEQHRLPVYLGLRAILARLHITTTDQARILMRGRIMVGPRFSRPGGTPDPADRWPR